MAPTSVFVSYCQESAEHLAWVSRLAERLESLPELHVIFDQFDLHGGKDLTHFMDSGLAADRIVAVITPEYVRRAHERLGGVGYESSVISAELLENALSAKVVPILRSGSARPSFLKSKLFIDFRHTHDYETALEDLRRALAGRPPMKRPPKVIESVLDTPGTPLISIPSDFPIPAAFRVSDPGGTQNWTSYVRGLVAGDVVTFLFAFLNTSASAERNLQLQLDVVYSATHAVATGTVSSMMTGIHRGTARLELAMPIELGLQYQRAWLYSHERHGASLDGARLLDDGIHLPEVAPGDGIYVTVEYLLR